MAQHVSIPKSFSEEDAHKWFSRFEICCANVWNDEMKALKLSMQLEGEPLSICDDQACKNQPSSHIKLLYFSTGHLRISSGEEPIFLNFKQSET